MMRIAIPILCLLLAACGPSQEGLVGDDEEVTKPAQLACALDGADEFTQDCTIQRFVGREGPTVVIGRADSGFRRFRLTDDGSGLATADGADRARVTILDGDHVEIRVGDDRYRLPAAIAAKPAASGETP